MKDLNTEKLFVEYRNGVSQTGPLTGRRYTLTHSDITAELYLVICLSYALDKINTMRDEVLGEWNIYSGQPVLSIYLYVGGQPGFVESSWRNYFFRKELPLALQAIRYGDRAIFNTYPRLDYSPIIVYFISANPFFNRVENWGTPKDYKTEADNRQNQTFTLDQLAQYTGKNGNPAYVAVNGIVYDVTNIAAWAAATHFGLSAGKDLTGAFASCHAGQPILNSLPIVGRLI